MDDFERELKIGFLDEADQIVSDLERCFLELEHRTTDQGLLDEVFRLVHNVKGSSRAVGFNALGAFTHEYETLLLKVKKGEVPVSRPLLNLLLKCLDFLREFLADLKNDLSVEKDFSALVVEIGQAIHQAASGAPAPVVAAPSVEVPAVPAEPATSIDEFITAPDPESDRLRLAAQAWDADENTANAASPSETSPVPLENQTVPEPPKITVAATPEPAPTSKPEPPPIVPVPPVVTATPMPAPSAVGAPAPVPPPPPLVPAAQAKADSSKSAAADESIRVSLGKIEKLLNYIGEVSILQAVVREQAQSDNPTAMRKTIHQLSKVTKEVQDIAMSLRMVPLKSTFQKMQRIVRDTAGVLGKDVQLIILGDETEVDKTVLENLSDPLVHLVRNAVDHGIESGDIRKATGKSAQGHVTLRAFHRGDKLILEVQDDGGGIPAEKLRTKAAQVGILKPGQVISDNEAIHLIFHPGFSTKSEVSQISGRGVGMDVVKTNIEKLQGSITVDTKLGEGSLFQVSLPLTMAIVDTLAVSLEDNRFIIPLSTVYETIRITDDILHRRTGVGDMLLIRGETIPLFSLSSLLGIRRKANRPNIALVVKTRLGMISVGVDDVIGQYQVVIKQLGPELKNMPGVMGCAILGDGKPSLILDLEEMIKRQRPQVTPGAERGVA